MSLFTIEPCDLLIVRDGRPKGETSVGQALAFPYPPTLAGGVRTRVGSLPGKGFVAGDRLDDLKKVAIRGPLLAALDRGVLYMQPPRDALLVRRSIDGTETLKRLVPLTDLGGAIGDFVQGLAPVGLTQSEHEPAKPVSLGTWWSWPLMEAWLRGEDVSTQDEWAKGRLDGLPGEGRLHVGLDAGGVAVEGALFETRGTRFVRSAGAAAHQSLSVSSYAMLVDVEDATLPTGMQLREELAPLGGERRLMRWARSKGLTLPTVPQWLVDYVTAGDGCRVRVVLATPGHFQAGARPANDGPLLGTHDGVTVRLTSMAVARPETFSGWDFAAPKGGRPKPSDRVVPAGSVYWLELGGSARARADWLARVWMQNVSDDDARRADGLGLALVGKGAD